MVGAGPGGPGWVCLGAVTGAFGVQGEVRIKTFTEQPLSLADYGPVTLHPGGRVVRVSHLKPARGGVTARLQGIGDRDAAAALKGTKLYVPRDALPAIEDEDSFYHEDLIGLEVEDTGGAGLGRIAAIHDFGAGDLLEVALNGGKTALIPFTREEVPVVDVVAGRVVVRARPGESEDQEKE